MNTWCKWCDTPHACVEILVERTRAMRGKFTVLIVPLDAKKKNRFSLNRSFRRRFAGGFMVFLAHHVMVFCRDHKKKTKKHFS